MAKQVKTRTYSSAVREGQAARTRSAVVAAARRLFAREGYAATSMSRIAVEAGVSLDTVYASVGRKPQLALVVIDDVLGGGAGPVAAIERDYVAAIRSAATAQEMIGIYAAALSQRLPELAPLQEALRQAGHQDAACAAGWTELVERRAANMLRFAAELRRAGGVRDDLSDQEVADIVWSTNAAEYFLLLQQRGWTPERFGRHLADVWTRVLLAGPVDGAP